MSARREEGLTRTQIPFERAGDTIVFRAAAGAGRNWHHGTTRVKGSEDACRRGAFPRWHPRPFASQARRMCLLCSPRLRTPTHDRHASPPASLIGWFLASVSRPRPRRPCDGAVPSSPTGAACPKTDSRMRCAPPVSARARLPGVGHSVEWLQRGKGGGEGVSL